MKLHQLFFCLLILFLPTQLGKHFWPDWTIVQGLRIDYLSPTLYLTDVLVFGTLASWWWEERKKKRENLAAGVFIGGFLILNSLLAASPPVAFYKLAKIIEFSLLGFYIAKNRLPSSIIYNLLSITIIYSSLIAIAQFLRQASLGGVFWFLGEREFNAGTPGIAQAILDGKLILRSYGTFPHPNVLGGFLAVILPLLIRQLADSKFRFPPFILGTIALFLTFSRSSWLIFGLSLMIYGFWFLKKARRQLLRYWPIFVVLIFMGAIIYHPAFENFQNLTSLQPESITLRQDLNGAAIKMVKSSPLFGVGLGNFLVRLPEFYQGKGPVRFLQPVHNIYFLIAAETGLIGAGLFLWLISLTYRRLIVHYSSSPPAKAWHWRAGIIHFSLTVALTAILFLGLFDHYFFTLQQGQLLMTLVLGLAWSKVVQLRRT